MDYIDKLYDQLARDQKVRKWKSRFTRMKKKTGESFAGFCARYKLDDSQINHQIEGKRGATWSHINKVEAALEAEGF